MGRKAELIHHEHSVSLNPVLALFQFDRGGLSMLDKQQQNQIESKKVCLTQCVKKSTSASIYEMQTQTVTWIYPNLSLGLFFGW